MYQYDAVDQDFVADRAREFREQVARRLSGLLNRVVVGVGA